MEKEDEIAGEGNSYTATFWQYDSRLGRRWKPDPVMKANWSGYAVLGNNPIVYVDKDGDDWYIAKIHYKSTFNSVYDSRFVIWIASEKMVEIVSNTEYIRIGSSSSRKVGGSFLRDYHEFNLLKNFESVDYDIILGRGYRSTRMMKSKWEGWAAPTGQEDITKQDWKVGGGIAVGLTALVTGGSSLVLLGGGTAAATTAGGASSAASTFWSLTGMYLAADGTADLLLQGINDNTNGNYSLTKALLIYFGVDKDVATHIYNLANLVVGYKGSKASYKNLFDRR